MGSNCQGVPEGRGTPGGGLRLCSERARSRQLGDLWGGRGGGEGQGTGVAGRRGWDTDWLCGGLSVPGGKRDEELILPINSSLSVTLHQDQVSMVDDTHRKNIYKTPVYRW